MYRPRDTRPQDARTLTMHVFEQDLKTFECTFLHVFCTIFFKLSVQIFIIILLKTHKTQLPSDFRPIINQLQVMWIKWNNSNARFFADNISSKVKEQLYAASTIKRYNCYVYNLHILDARVKKGRTFRKQKIQKLPNFQ